MIGWILAIILLVVVASMWILIYGIDLIQWCAKSPAQAIGIGILLCLVVYLYIRMKRKDKGSASTQVSGESNKEP